ncbi:hypothetical protein AGMMS49975_12110 [Clostridia bacterium]|nr:hypothetical protein AGMMS49975_12110 [Clostridia bacterium]
MEKIIVQIANANNNLADCLTDIETAVRHAEEYAVPALGIEHNINLVVADVGQFAIPEDHVGGRTYRADFILIDIDERAKPGKDAIFEMICHELAHAARWGKNPEYTKSLLDCILNEGLAVAFEEQAARDSQLNKTVFLQTMIDRPDEENRRILAKLTPQLYDEHYDYTKIFFDGDESVGLPRWAGYSLGFYLIRQYLQRTNRSLRQAVTDDYDKLKAGAL